MAPRRKIGGILAILAAAALLASCACPRRCACAPSIIRDSVYFEVRDSVIIRDTVLSVQVPADSAFTAAAPADTARAETNVAEAAAWLDEAGAVQLELRNKPVQLLAPVTLPALKIHLERSGKAQTITRTVEVEKKLTGWQRLCLKVGAAAIWLLILAAAAGIVILVLKIRGIWFTK